MSRAGSAVVPAGWLAIALCGCGGCGKRDARPTTTAAPTSLSAVPGYDPDWRRPRDKTPQGGDPLGGRFTLADATRDLGPGEGLEARIDTSRGSLQCTLWPDKAPRTVANFVGLANGLRPWRGAAGWRKRPAYDGSSFHRVIAGVAIVGGRPAGSDAAGIGYAIADERWPGMRHDRAGLLCARGRAPNQVGAEFLITAGPAPRLDGQRDAGERAPAFTVFGHCRPLARIEALAASADEHGRPREHLAIERIRVVRPAGTEPAD